MLQIFIVLAALLGGVGLGFILGGAINKALACRVQSLRKELAGKRPKMGTMSKIIAFIFVVLFAFVVVILFMFWHTGSEPSTLITCVFGLCGTEFGILGWIKTTKEKQASKVPELPELPVEKEEPPDVGV